MEEKSVLLKVELDVTALKTSAKEAEERLGVLKPQMEALRKESGTGTLEYAKLKEEVKQYTKQLNDSAAAIQINEKLAVKNTQSNVELAQAQKALAVAYNNLTQDQRENTEEGRRITEQYKAINDALNENALSVSDGRRNVGLYAESIKKAYAELDVMKKEVNQIGYAMSSNQKELDKNTKALNDLAKSGDTTSAEYRSLQENVDFYTEAVQMNNATLNQANDELKQQEEQLAKTEKEARKVGFVYGQQEEQTKSLKAQLKELKAELATMDPNSEAFIEGSKRAGELADKIKIAATVFDLKDAESGNKEKQELLDKITELTNINAATVDSHKNIVSQLTSNLEESSKIIQELRTNNETYKTALQTVVREESDKVEFFKTGNKNRFDELDSLSRKFNNRELQYLKSLNLNDGFLNIENIPENVLTKFYEVGILKKENSNIKLTVLGKMFQQYI